MKTVIQPAGFIADARAAGISDQERIRIVSVIAISPMQGVLIVGSGGARKVRVAGRGKGKSGGFRLVFYPAPDDVPLLMITAFSKGDSDNLSKAAVNAMREELAGYVDDYRTSARNKIKQLGQRRRG